MSVGDTTSEAHRHYLIGMREKLSFSQTEMGRALGMSLRAYSDIETGVSKCRKIHVLAAERVLLREAAGQKNLDLLTTPLVDDFSILKLVGRPKPPGPSGLVTLKPRKPLRKFALQAK